MRLLTTTNDIESERLKKKARIKRAFELTQHN
jgi:hypothetical protein